jgi:hypothetical protein
METVHKLEETIGGWLKSFPHLPKTWTDWLAKYAWLLVLIGVILSALGAVMLLFAVLAIGAVTSVYGIVVEPLHNSWWYITTVITLVLLVVTVIIDAMAVGPLKAMKSKGWELLFLTFLVSVVSELVSVLYNFGNIISAIIAVVVSAYILYELKPYFKPKATKE